MQGKEEDKKLELKPYFPDDVVGEKIPPPPPPPFDPTPFFGRDVRRYLEEWHSHHHDRPTASQRSTTSSNSCTINFCHNNAVVLRQVMEPHIVKARQARRRALQGLEEEEGMLLVGECRAASQWRRQRTLTVDTARLGQALADLLQVSDLARLHQQESAPALSTTTTRNSKRRLLQPLLDAEARYAFHSAYHTMVRQHVLPVIVASSWEASKHSRNSIDDNTGRLRIRYQAFPCLRVIRPGEFSIGPHCDAAYGHSSVNLNVYCPLSLPLDGSHQEKGGGGSTVVDTALSRRDETTAGTAWLYTESQPGAEDWHALPHGQDCVTVWDGARCIHFTLENTSHMTRVSLDFRVAVVPIQNDDHAKDIPAWQDRYTTPPDTYYEYGTVDPRNGQIHWDGPWSRQIDPRVGFPFGRG